MKRKERGIMIEAPKIYPKQDNYVTVLCPFINLSMLTFGEKSFRMFRCEDMNHKVTKEARLTSS